MAPDFTSDSDVFPSPTLKDENSFVAEVILVRDPATGRVLCRMPAHPPPLPPVPSSRSCKDASSHQGKLAQEVLEVVQGLTGCSHVVLTDGPDASSSLAFTRSDSLGPGTYYAHRSGALKLQQSPPPHSWQSQVAAVIVALITLGAVFQSMIFTIAVPYCGCNWRCLHAWYKVFISHIDGPFKVFTFVAAIQRAAAHPSVWLDGFGKLTRGIARLLHRAARPEAVPAMRCTTNTKQATQSPHPKKD